MSLVLNVEILGEFKKLTAATTGAQSDLQRMSGQATKISKGIGKAFAAIGIGLSFRVLANELEDAAKAAIEDVKSQQLLALAMENTGKATDKTITSAEDYIKKMQFSAGVADDRLRPAYQKLFIATGDVTESNRLLSIALDASAATGKDLDTVSQAMAKSLAGNDAALAKLIPSLKGSKDPIDEMGKAFDGAAAKAANLDPYQKMQIVFQDLQEQVGMALLPILEKFSAWVASPEGQQKLQGFIDLVTGLAGKFEILSSWAIDNADALIAWSGVIVGAGIALKTLTTAASIYNTISTAMAAKNAAVAVSNTAVATTANTATASIVGTNAAATTLIGTLGLLAGAAIGAGIGGFQQGQIAGQTAEIYRQGDTNGRLFSGLAQDLGFQKKPTTAPSPTNVNININKGNVNATDITKALDDYYRATGVRLAQ